MIVPLAEEHVDAVARLSLRRPARSFVVLSELGVVQPARAYYTGCVRTNSAVGSCTSMKVSFGATCWDQPTPTH